MLDRRPRLWILSGPSCAGKTSLLASEWIGELTSVASGAPILYAGNLEGRRELPGDAYLHFNLLRPARRAIGAGGDPRRHDFSADPGWRAALELRASRRALILVADKETLVARVKRRTAREPGSRLAYPARAWLEIFERVDLDSLYAAWRRELDRQGIPWIEIDAADRPADAPPRVLRRGPAGFRRRARRLAEGFRSSSRPSSRRR